MQEAGQLAMASMAAISLRLLPAPSGAKKAAATGMGSLIPARPALKL